MAKAKANNRPKRVPVAGNRDVLTVEGKEDGYVYRWVNDTDNGRRISKFRNAGYEMVEQEGISVGDVTVNNAEREGRASVVSENVGKGVTAHLMRVPKEFYEEDQAAKQKDIDDREADMRRKLNSGADGRYGGFNIT